MFYFQRRESRERIPGRATPMPCNHLSAKLIKIATIIHHRSNATDRPVKISPQLCVDDAKATELLRAENDGTINSAKATRRDELWQWCREFHAWLGTTQVPMDLEAIKKRVKSLGTLTRPVQSTIQKNRTLIINNFYRWYACSETSPLILRKKREKIVQCATEPVVLRNFAKHQNGETRLRIEIVIFF